MVGTNLPMLHPDRYEVRPAGQGLTLVCHTCPGPNIIFDAIGYITLGELMEEAVRHDQMKGHTHA